MYRHRFRSLAAARASGRRLMQVEAGRMHSVPSLQSQCVWTCPCWKAESALSPCSEPSCCGVVCGAVYHRHQASSVQPPNSFYSFCLKWQRNVRALTLNIVRAIDGLTSRRVGCHALGTGCGNLNSRIHVVSACLSLRFCVSERVRARRARARVRAQYACCRYRSSWEISVAGSRTREQES